AGPWRLRHAPDRRCGDLGVRRRGRAEARVRPRPGSGKDMIGITPHPDGATLAVRAQPNAKKNAVVGEHGGALKVVVTAPPEDGRANEAITGVLRDWLGLKRSQVELAAGPTNRNKQFLIRGLTPDELTA